MGALSISVAHAEIDAIHEELAVLAEKAAIASDSVFPQLFTMLLEHTAAHFAHEEQLMQESGFLHAAEHLAEHKQMLREMQQFGKRALPFARAYVRQRLPERFALHITRMDSLLAAFLRSQ